MLRRYEHGKRSKHTSLSTAASLPLPYSAYAWTSNERPLQSKKFIAYLLAELSWKVLAGLVLFWGKDSMAGSTFFLMTGIIVIAGFIEAGYILGQASLDKYLRVAEIAVGAGHEVSMDKAQIKITKQPKKVPPPVPPADPDEAVIEEPNKDEG